MKQVSNKLAQHLAGEVTTLARLLKVTRADGTVLRFTDFDQNLAYDDTVTPHTLSNVLNTVVTGGGSWFMWSGWDIDQTRGTIWSAQYHLIGAASALVKTTLSGGVLSMTHIDTSTSALSMTRPGGVIADPIDGTILVRGTVGGSSLSVKYDYDSDTVLQTSTTAPVPIFGASIAPAVWSNERYGYGSTIYSAADFSTVSTYNLASLYSTTATIYNLVWDKPRNRFLASLGGSIGIGHGTVLFDLNNKTPSGLTELLDGSAEANPPLFSNVTNWANGIYVSPDGQYGVANHENFIDFFTLPDMNLISHVSLTYPPGVTPDVIIDVNNIAYFRSAGDGQTITQYDCTTGTLIGSPGTFTVGDTSLDGGLGMLYHPTEGTWLLMHGNGNLQAMLMRLPASPPYKFVDGLTLSAVEHKSDASPDNLQVTGFLDDNGINEHDVRARLYDNATFELREVNWSDLSQGDLKLLKGTIGDIVMENGAYKIELRGLTQKLSTTIGSTYGPTCRAELFGGGAEGIDPANHWKCRLNRSDWVQTGTVDSSPDSLTIVPVSSGSPLVSLVMRGSSTPTDPAPVGWFADGLIVFTSGNLKGYSFEIAAWDGTTLTLFAGAPMPFAPSPGDTFEIEPGCDKTMATCHGKFNNAINHAAEANIPGLNVIGAVSRTQIKD